MYQPRHLLILSALPIGLSLGTLAWLISGDGGSMSRNITDLRLDLGKPPPGLNRLYTPSGALAPDLAARPLFALSVGPGALQDPNIQLIGLAITPRSRAALIVVNGSAPQWVRPGDTVNDFKIGQVTARGVEVDLPLGSKLVSLSDAPAVAASAPGPGLTGPNPNVRP